MERTSSRSFRVSTERPSKVLWMEPRDHSRPGKNSWELGVRYCSGTVVRLARVQDVQLSGAEKARAICSATTGACMDASGIAADAWR